MARRIPRPIASKATAKQVALHCPTCRAPMKEIPRQGIPVDVCEDHGIWFGHGELDEVIARINDRVARAWDTMARRAWQDGEAVGTLGGVLPPRPAPPKQLSPQRSHAAKPEASLSCPVCAAPLGKQPLEHVTTDVCVRHGVWLDRGELAEIVQRGNRKVRIDRVNRVDRYRVDGVLSAKPRSRWWILLLRR